MSRRLRPEERALWQEVAKSASPMHPKRKVEAPFQGELRERPSEPKSQVLPFEIGQKARATATSIPTGAMPAPRMDAKAHRKLVRGKLDPEARIDLHGMRVDEAHPELINFILRSHAKGRRLVLVITGKGQGPGPAGPLPYQRGILRRQVPHWLRQNPVAPLILETRPAAPKHGGDGALYVYLRRRR